MIETAAAAATAVLTSITGNLATKALSLIKLDPMSKPARVLGLLVGYARAVD